jgi:predicted negative regulator of RcsB-dependent stress response
MAKKAKPVKNVPLEEKSVVFEKIAEFVKSNQLLLTIVLAALALGALGYSVYSQMKSNEADEANRIYDVAMSEVQMMINSDDETQRQQLFQDHLTQLDGLIQSYPKTVAAVRARLYMGKIYFSEAYQSGNVQAIASALQYYSDARDYA